MTTKAKALAAARKKFGPTAYVEFNPHCHTPEQREAAKAAGLPDYLLSYRHSALVKHPVHSHERCHADSWEELIAKIEEATP